MEDLEVETKGTETEKIRLFEVCNDMMNPVIQVGARIVCNNITGSSFIEWGEIHVLIIDGLPHTCRLFPSDKEDSYKVKYDNKDYPVNYIPKCIVSGVYRAIGVMTLL